MHHTFLSLSEYRFTIAGFSQFVCMSAYKQLWAWYIDTNFVGGVQSFSHAVTQFGDSPGIRAIPIDCIAVGNHLGGRFLREHARPEDVKNKQNRFQLRHYLSLTCSPL